MLANFSLMLAKRYFVVKAKGRGEKCHTFDEGGVGSAILEREQSLFYCHHSCLIIFLRFLMSCLSNFLSL